jgi:hypothetical protein
MRSMDLRECETGWAGRLRKGADGRGEIEGGWDWV